MGHDDGERSAQEPDDEKEREVQRARQRAERAEEQPGEPVTATPAAAVCFALPNSRLRGA
jgi:hypothetical protein